MFDWLSDFFSSNDSPPDFTSSSSYCSSSSDWTDAFGTACDFQVPAESCSIHSHDFTTTTFGDSPSADWSSSSNFDSSTWD